LVADGLVLVTGATGFVGSALCAALERNDTAFRRAVGRPANSAAGDVVVGEIGPDTDWREALRGTRAVVHLAARTHVLRDGSRDPLAEYRRINVAGTRCLAEAAAEAGVARFIFMSSVKVNGERTGAQPFRETDQPRPQDAYGVTKVEAEQELARVAAGSGMAVTILRPPLVYGPGVKGNFLALMRAIYRGVPLPLASVDNRRSLVYVENLASAVLACLEKSQSAGETYLVSDGEDLSTPEMIRRLAAALGTRPRLFAFSPALLRVAGAVSGRGEQIARLTGSLCTDSTKFRRDLGWAPPFSVEEGFARTAHWFVSCVEPK
jgi:nucleoside-diphosphate-sugar epimerase